MTTRHLESQFHRRSGLTAVCMDLDPRTGEVPVRVTDSEGKNEVMLRFPYKALGDPGLTDALTRLYFGELNIRRARKAEKKKT